MLAENESTLDSVYNDFQSSVKNPEIFLSVQPKKEKKFKNLTKNLYDVSIKLQNDETFNPTILPELILDSMDEEQIWQQLELRNNHMMGKFLKDTSRLLSLKETSLSFKCRPADTADESEAESTNESNATQESDLEDENSDSQEGLNLDTPKKPSTKAKKMISSKKSIVDDSFFKLSEMEQFLKAEDEKEMRKHGKNSKSHDRDEEIDYFKDDDESKEEDDVDEEDLKYGDFFDGDDDIEDNELQEGTNKLTKRKRGTDDSEESFNEEEDTQKQDQENDDDSNLSDDDNKDDHPKSSFEERQDRLQQHIKEQEEIALGEKPWQLKGEITAITRPKNSLLEEILEFDSTTRPAPVITEETTLRLEDIIRQRIKDTAWDDVERKHKPVQTTQDLRKKLVLDHEKSKESLAQVYEKEYQKQLDNFNPKQTDDKDEEPENHREIRKLMRDLFIKLDALSNFHYTPKPSIPELRIITNTPAVDMEEVAPVAMSNAKLLAPEEVRGRVKGDFLGKSERDRTDKNRERRKKKSKQKFLAKAKEESLQNKQKMGIQLSSKEEKSKLMKNVMKHRNVEKMAANGTDSSAMKSSKVFFTQLQDKVSIEKSAKVKKKKAPKEHVSAKRLKL